LEILNYDISAAYGISQINCPVGYSNKLKKIFIESAEVLGLKLIPVELRKPLFLNSRGLGQIIRQIQKDVLKNKLRVDEIVIGVGGTGTVDLGIGMMSQLGLKLFDEENNSLKEVPDNFNRITKIDWTKPSLPFKIKVIVDVDIPLFGNNGGIKIFGPQKGASLQEIEKLEEGFENIFNLMKFDKNIFHSGAGGGLAAGINLFLEGKYITSKQFILDDLDLKMKEKLIYDIIITGEGRFDSQSKYNKGVTVILDEYRDINAPVFIICGSTDDNINNQEINLIELSKYFNSKEESIKNIEKGILLACKEIINKSFLKNLK
jgi:glycerate kinase